MLKQHIIGMTGKVVLITGGSRGLGRAMALGFAEAGADIVVASRRIESCGEVARAVEKLGRRAMAHACHIGMSVTFSRMRHTRALVRWTSSSTMQANPLSTTGPIDIDEKLYDSVLDLNLKGPFRLTAVIGQRMMDAGGGAIVCRHRARW